MSALASDRSLVLFRAGNFDPVLGVPAGAGFALTEFRDRSSGSCCTWCSSADARRSGAGMLEKHGATLLHYIPNNAYLVKMDSARISRLSEEKGVRSAFRLPKFAKLDPYVMEDVTRSRKVELMACRGGFRIHGEILGKRFPKTVFVSAEYITLMGGSLWRWERRTCEASWTPRGGSRTCCTSSLGEPQLFNDTRSG